jgi:hypothetical protein
MKAYGGVDVYIHVFLTSELVGGVVSFTPQAALSPGKKLRYPLDRRLGVPQSRSGRRREQKANSQAKYVHEINLSYSK